MHCSVVTTLNALSLSFGVLVCVLEKKCIKIFLINKKNFGNVNIFKPPPDTPPLANYNLFLLELLTYSVETLVDTY
jgi:hypothetical protein